MTASQRQKETPVPPELQPYYDGNKGSGRLAWILRLVALFIIVVLLALGVFWLIHRHTNSKPTTAKPIGSTQSSTKQPVIKPKTATPATPTNPENNGSSDTNADTTTPSANVSQSAGTPAAIPNTGPGDTLAIFGGATIVGTAAYQIFVRRKLAQA